MRVATLSMFVLLVLGASAMNSQLRGKASAQAKTLDPECPLPSLSELPDVVTDATESEVGEIVPTTATVGGEELPAYLPTDEDFVDEAPIAVVEIEGDQVIVQVLESYETDSGESIIVINAGGEAVTLPGEIVETETPLAPVVINGEVTVVEVAGVSECSNGESFVVVATGDGEYEAVEAQVVAEPVVEIPAEFIPVPEQVPDVLIGEATPEVLPTTVTIGGEEITAFVPESGLAEDIPLSVVETDEGTYVVQVLESHEGEVVVNIGGGETITIQGEVVEAETPLTPIIVEGEVVVAEVLSVSECADGRNYAVVATGDGEYEAVEAQLATDDALEFLGESSF